MYISNIIKRTPDLNDFNCKINAAICVSNSFIFLQNGNLDEINYFYKTLNVI